jgi:hypothetical protein
LDVLLDRQSFGPGTFILLAGRMHTRKTAVMVNFIHNLLKQDVPCGLVGLDEATHMYIAKLMSVLTQRDHTEFAKLWGTPAMAAMSRDYLTLTKGLTMSLGHRPNLEELDKWLDMAEVGGQRPRAVFIDYLSLLERDKWGTNKGVDRVPRLCEDLQVWTNKNELVTVALHQVGRASEFESQKNHGAVPGTPEDLMYGGEQQADIILQTYRPTLDKVGNMRQEDAVSQGVDPVDWQLRADRVLATQDDTYLQLTKNRPGVHLDYTGIKLVSKRRSQYMEVRP